MADKLGFEAETRPLVLVDGSSYLFRAYFAMPELTTSSGRHTGAIRGVISMIRKLAKDYAGSTIAVVFDAPGKTFRDDMYSEYKANREAMADDLREQIEPIHQIIRAMGLPLLGIFGATDPGLTAMTGDRVRVIVSNHLPCIPCKKRECQFPKPHDSSNIYPPCLEPTTPESVWQALRLQIGSKDTKPG